MEYNILTELIELVNTHWVEILAIGGGLGITIEKTPIKINPISFIKKIGNKLLKDFGNAVNQDLNVKVEDLSKKIDQNTDKVAEMEKMNDFANIDIMKRALTQYHSWSIQNGFLYNKEYQEIRTIELKYRAMVEKYAYLPKGERPNGELDDIFTYLKLEFEKGHVRFDKPKPKFKHEQEYVISEYMNDEYDNRNDDPPTQRTRKR